MHRVRFVIRATTVLAEHGSLAADRALWGLA